MNRALLYVSTLLVMAGGMRGQSTGPLLRFEAADVHASPHAVLAQTAGGFIRRGRYEIRNASIVDLISSAYGIPAEKIEGGPGWLDSDRFDVIAKAAAGTTNDAAKLMLRSLLADRFKLAIHTEDKPSTVYALTVAKGGPKLKETSGGQTGCRSGPQNPTGGGDVSYQQVVCIGMTMSRLALLLPGAGGYATDHPVVDRTELTGSFDFELKFTNRGLLAAAGRDGISLFDALEKQLGLNLELKVAPLPVVVVDNVKREPTPNEPDIVQKLPVVRAEFEVANIKPSAPGSRNGANLQPGGRLDSSNTLKGYLRVAFDGLPADMIVGPSWLDTQRFDIVAKAPSDISGVSGGDLDINAMRMLARNLLIDRFKLAWHTEVQPVSAFTLVAPKKETKLKKGDPSVRTSCRPGNTNTAPNSAPLTVMECHNTTMAQLAERLPGWAPAYVDHPAVDLTGIDGGWDFTLSWTPRGAFEAARQAGDGGQRATGATAASDPNGAVSFFEAVERQLGLKLELKQHPLPVIVVDHMEQEPTQN